MSAGMEEESRNWFAVALVQEVRSAARWVLKDLMLFSAWPRRLLPLYVLYRIALR